MPKRSRLTVYGAKQVESLDDTCWFEVKGFLDQIEINKITKFEDLLLSELISKEKKIIESITKEQAISETLEKKISDFLQSLSKKFIEDNK